MAEYIEREKVEELIKNYGKGAISDGLKTLDPVDDIVSLVRGLDLIPAADVAPVIHGKNLYNGHPVDGFICSNCGFYTEEIGRYIPDEDDPDISFCYEYEFKFCPNCGAKMDGGKAK